MKKYILAIVAASLLNGGAMVYATASVAILRSDRHLNAGNPAALERLMPQKATLKSLHSLEKNLVTHAGTGASDDWFRYPEMFWEYGFSYNNDKRAGGIDADVHSATMGVSWITFWDINVGGILTGSVSDGDAITNTHSDTTSVVGTLYLSKTAWDCFIYGSSFSFGNSETDTTMGVNTSTHTNMNSNTISPYIGGFWSEKEWSVNSTLTYSVTMQKYDYNINVANTSSSTGSLIWATNVGYTVNEEWRLGVNLTPNFIVHDESQAINVTPNDDLWMNVGGNVSYSVEQDWVVNGGYSYDAFQSDFDNHNVNVGATHYF
ncbi:MAG: hypothetical protein ACOY3I_07530 [Verrucomicrobiota bacterium]